MKYYLPLAIFLVTVSNQLVKSFTSLSFYKTREPVQVASKTLVMSTEEEPTKRRRTSKIELPSAGIGCKNTLQFHEYGPPDASETAYIQTTLHADELPGLLVSNHLLKFLDKAQRLGAVLKKVIIVPYANPIGLSQHFLGYFPGRFSLSTGTNFNREFLNVTDRVYARLVRALQNATAAPDEVLSVDNEVHNVAVVRRAILAEIDEAHRQSLSVKGEKEEVAMKRLLYSKACVADIVLDLHCDCDAVMHMYTHDRLWPQMSDLAAEIGSHCTILAPYSGGDPFDEACSCPWADLQDKLNEGPVQYPLPMACQSATIELRGESDVYDHLAEKDARALFRFLSKRGYISLEALSAILPDITDEQPISKTPKAVPLTGVDMIEATHNGVLAWKVKAGDVVEKDQILGEIVNIEDPDAPRVPVITRTAGIVFGLRRHKLARPGEICIKVAGDMPLSWRTGHLLTSK